MRYNGLSPRFQISSQMVTASFCFELDYFPFIGRLKIAVFVKHVVGWQKSLVHFGFYLLFVQEEGSIKRSLPCFMLFRAGEPTKTRSYLHVLL